jgi:GDPmannose 4,6-dehydratase
MLQQDKPKDYVIATGETHSVREFVEESFNAAGIPINWEGKGLDEVGKHNGKVVVRINPVFFRPAEVDILLGDSSKAKKELGWEPKIKFKELVKMMVENDLKNLQKHGLSPNDN